MRSCPICSGSAAVNLGELSNTKIAPLARSSYDLAHCRECDLVYLSPLPSERDLEILYIDELQFDYYTEESSRSVVEFILSRLRAVLEGIKVGDTRTVLERAGLKKAHLKRPLSVLEIGAGPAWMSRAAKSFSPDSLTVAQDVTPEMASKCPWVDHYVVGFTDAPEIDAYGPYDVISMTHVIEHLPDPVGMLRRLRPITRGIVFLTAPHRPVKWDGSIEGWRTYSYHHVPGHLQYFSEQSLRRAAEASGFSLAYWDATSEDGQAFEAWLRPQT